MFRKPVMAAKKAEVKLIGLASFQVGKALTDAFAEAGSVRSRIAEIYPFDKAKDALQKLKAAKTAGKIAVGMK